MVFPIDVFSVGACPTPQEVRLVVVSRRCFQSGFVDYMQSQHIILQSGRVSVSCRHQHPEEHHLVHEMLSLKSAPSSEFDASAFGFRLEILARCQHMADEAGTHVDGRHACVQPDTYQVHKLELRRSSVSNARPASRSLAIFTFAMCNASGKQDDNAAEEIALQSGHHESIEASLLGG